MHVIKIKADQVFLVTQPASQQSNNKMKPRWNENSAIFYEGRKVARVESEWNAYLFPQFFFCLQELSTLVFKNLSNILDAEDQL